MKKQKNMIVITDIYWKDEGEVERACACAEKPLDPVTKSPSVTEANPAKANARCLSVRRAERTRMTFSLKSAWISLSLSL